MLTFQGLCTFVNDVKEDTMDWLIGSGSAVDPLLAPPLDNTLGNEKVKPTFHQHYCNGLITLQIVCCVKVSFQRNIAQ